MNKKRRKLGKICPAPKHKEAKAKQRGSVKHVNADRPIARFFSDPLMLSTGDGHSSIITHLGIPSTTTHVCLTCLRSWLNSLNCADEDAAKRYMKAPPHHSSGLAAAGAAIGVANKKSRVGYPVPATAMVL